MAKPTHNYVLVEGLRPLGRVFGELPKELRRELPAMMRKLAEPAAAEAKARVSIGGGKDPHAGRLQGKIRAFGTRYGAQVGFTGVPYGGVVEFAVRPFRVRAHERAGHRVGAYVRRQAKRPFLIPAVEAQAGRAEAVVGREMQAFLDRVVGEGVR